MYKVQCYVMLFHFSRNAHIFSLPSCLYLSHLFLFKSLRFSTSLHLSLPLLFTRASLKFITFYTCLVILNDGLWTMKFGYKLSPPAVSTHNLVMRHEVISYIDIRFLKPLFSHVNIKTDADSAAGVTRNESLCVFFIGIFMFQISSSLQVYR